MSGPGRAPSPVPRGLGQRPRPWWKRRYRSVKALGFFAGYIRDYARLLALVVISMLLLTAVQLAAPWVIRSMIETATDPLAGPESADTIATLALLALGLYVLQGGLRFVRSYVAHVAGWGMVADARRRIYQHLQRLSLRFYEDRQVGQLMSRMVNDSELFERLVAHAVPDVAVNVLSFAGVSIVLASLNWRLLLLSLIPVGHFSASKTKLDSDFVTLIKEFSSLLGFNPQIVLTDSET